MQQECVFLNLSYSVHRGCAALAFEKYDLGACKKNYIEPSFFPGYGKFEEYLPFIG